MNTDEYLTVTELAARLKLAPGTVRNKMGSVWHLGEHYVRPPGMPPRFKWSAIVAWLEGRPAVTQAGSPGRAFD